MTTEALDKAGRLVDAEDFLDLFEIPYDPQVVRVNRLHILKKFALLKAEIDRDGDRAGGGLAPDVRFTRYQEAKRSAYATFLVSTGPQEKLFKVFQAPTVPLTNITPATPAVEGES
jgi:nitrogenase-stabilizing/protective protein